MYYILGNVVNQCAIASQQVILLKEAESPSAYRAAASCHPQHHQGVWYQQLYMNIINNLLSCTSVASWRVTI